MGDKVFYRPNVQDLLEEIGAIVSVVITEKAGIPKDQANEIGKSAAVKIARNWSGVTMYFPRGLVVDERHAQIYNDYDGDNIKALAFKHKLTDQQIYNIIRRMRAMDIARNQPGLFDDHPDDSENENA